MIVDREEVREIKMMKSGDQFLLELKLGIPPLSPEQMTSYLFLLFCNVNYSSWDYFQWAEWIQLNKN